MLFVFLSYWVQSVYESERDSLKKEITYSFKDVIRNIEDSLVQNILLSDIPGGKGFNDFNIRKEQLTHDSVNVIIKKSIDTTFSDEDTTIKVMVQEYSDTNINLTDAHLLPMLINWTSDTSIKGEMKLTSTLRVVELITDDFDKVMKDGKFPGNYDIITRTRSDKPNALSVDFYNDPESEFVYTASFQGSTMFILKRIWPSILFAVILFVAVLASFIMIYRNWRNQERLIDIKNDFVSNVTHELKTPISTVSVALEALSDFNVLNDKAKTEEYLNISKSELNRLKILVDKVLKMSLFEKTSNPINLEVFDLTTLISGIVSTLHLKHEQLGVEVDFKASEENSTIEADKIHFTNVIYNLLDNAVKYGGQQPKIQILLDRDESNIVLRIRDNGIGIHPQDKDKIFNRFYRSNTGMGHDVKGHGLGLSYVKSVLDRHQATINVESTIGEGSEFIIRINRYHG